ncbi:FtsX-like permease family protein [Thermopolyspora sp. NPDC052614]|uniref:FtsX-like permease family protein n=1 Tax=Thermopolyspora sp. NPDC052614 TaxID=3155682 RepID=UPI0034403016
MSAHGARRRGSSARWAGDLALGMRLSVTGGRPAWFRLALISLGVALGVAMLLVAASIPAAVAARDGRLAARDVDWSQELGRGEDTLLIKRADTRYRDIEIYGRVVRPEGKRAPLPPGVTRWPGAGEMLVSPALARLLAEDGSAGERAGAGARLRDRWDAHVAGTIGAEGLTGPGEYAFYLVSDRLSADSASRVRAFGESDADQGVPPALLLLGAVAVVALLLPVAIFVTTAVRFGGEARDRRLAALRLFGADTAMTRRIAAGETLVGAVLGLAAGGLLYLALRLLAEGTSLVDASFHPDDLRPVPALTVLIVVLVPVTAVLITLSALRRVAVEPLGVVRLGGEHRRRLWWRLILPVAGPALLYPLRNGFSEQATGFEAQVMAGMAALLIGVALLLPWVVEAVVRRLRGGSVAWELAVRRLQLDSGTAVRAVSGIAVSVAGAIALHGLFGAVQAQFTVENGRDTSRFQAVVLPTFEIGPGLAAERKRWESALRDAPGVRTAAAMILVHAALPGSADESDDVALRVGSCAVLRLEARIGDCADGDTFVVASPTAPAPRPGTAYALVGSEQKASASSPRWTLPADARTAPILPGSLHASESTILATPGALRGTRFTPVTITYYAGLDPADPDAFDRLRNAVGRLDPTAPVQSITAQSFDGVLLGLRQGLLAGALALLLLIGSSLLVNVAEQLHERRRPLAVLIASGTPRSTLSASILYQIAIPVLLGLILAVLTGTALSGILQAAAGTLVRFDWVGIGVTSGAAALVVLLTTAAGLPLLRRVSGPEGLRSE